MPTTNLLIRPAAAADLGAITAIYAWNVDHGTGTFELDPPDLAEMTRRHADVAGKGLPWLVAERDGSVLGYAYANHFRARPAYRFCLEDSVYLSPDAQGQGVGRLLLAELCARCEAGGTRQMLAVIGDSANAASIGLHRGLGFEQVGLTSS
jgi:L-amino acid N-acyltransferase YncA